MLQQFKQLHVIATDRCQLRCVHCALSAKGSVAQQQDLSLEALTAVIRLARGHGVRDIVLSGGEPFIRRDLLEVVRLTLALDVFACTIGTNGLAISTQALRELAALQAEHPELCIRISLDGASSHTHDALRGIGSFRRTMRTMDRLLDAGIAIMGINTVITRKNYTELDDLYITAKQAGVQDLTLIDLVPIGRATQLPHLQLGLEEWQTIYTWWRRLKGIAGPSIAIRGPYNHSLLQAVGFAPAPIVLETMYLGAAGNLFLCYPHQFSSGIYINGRTEEQAWLEAVRSMHSISRRCETCPIRVLCHGAVPINEPTRYDRPAATRTGSTVTLQEVDFE